MAGFEITLLRGKITFTPEEAKFDLPQHDRVGHVFQGRYKAILVEKNEHLLKLCRYIVLNPVRAGIESEPKKWVWSSYQATAYSVKVPDFFDSRLDSGTICNDKK